MSGLFFPCLRSLLRDASVEKKLKVAIEIMDEVSTQSWDDTIIYSHLKSGDFIISIGLFTWLTGRLLLELDPSLNLNLVKGQDFYLHQSYWSHPYLVQIVKRIGQLAIPEGWNLSIDQKKVTLDRNKPPREVYTIYQERTDLLASLKSPEEVDKVIDRVLREEKIEVDLRGLRVYLQVAALK